MCFPTLNIGTLHNLDTLRLLSCALLQLCDAMLSMELHERFASPHLTFNTLDPGTVNTKMLIAGWGACGIDVVRHLRIDRTALLRSTS